MAELGASTRPTPRGWYEDPTGKARWRYWDGSAWTPWIDGGDASVPDPSGAPDAAAPSESSAKGLQRRDVEPRPLQIPGSHPGVQPASSPADGRSGSVVWLVIAEVAAVPIGLMLISSAPHPVGGEEFASGAVLGFLLALGGLVLFRATLVVWLVDVVVRTRKARLGGR